MRCSNQLQRTYLVIPRCFIRLPERRTQPRRPPCPVASPSTQTEARVLRLEQVQAQQPGPGEVWLEQAAIGINPLDLGQRSGAVPIPLPSGLGLEGAGVVAALGPGVSGLAPGDRVAYATGPLGAYASARLYPPSAC